MDGHARVLWCVQLLVNIGLNTTYNTVIDFADTANLKRAAWLVQNYAQRVTTQIRGAAFQLAIWDMMEDSAGGAPEPRVAVLVLGGIALIWAGCFRKTASLARLKSVHSGRR